MTLQTDVVVKLLRRTTGDTRHLTKQSSRLVAFLLAFNSALAVRSVAIAARFLFKQIILVIAGGDRARRETGVSLSLFFWYWPVTSGRLVLLTIIISLFSPDSVTIMGASRTVHIKQLTPTGFLLRTVIAVETSGTVCTEVLPVPELWKCL